MDKQVRRLIINALESFGYDVREDDGCLFVDEEDSNNGVRVTIEVIP